MIRLFMSAALAAVVASAAHAEQRLTTRPNGSVRISASAEEVTRISVAGDRIRRIIKDQTSFQEMNDETTGDVFLRYAGDKAKLVPETGYILTERGVTISYELTPSARLGAETVLISVAGMPPEGATAGAAPAAEVRSDGFELAGGEGGGGYASGLVAFTRATIDKHIAGRAAPKRSHGSVVGSESGTGMRAKVLVAAGGRGGRYVRPQDFYTPKVLGVWVQRNALGPSENAWVVVVEKR